jgi:trans-aconitate methyltransferase
MPKPGSPAWTASRYFFRRDVIRKIVNRYRSYRRRAERNPFSDVAHAIGADATVVFDVGANIGLVTSKLLKLFPAAQIHV